MVTKIFLHNLWLSWEHFQSKWYNPFKLQIYPYMVITMHVLGSVQECKTDGSLYDRDLLSSLLSDKDPARRCSSISCDCPEWCLALGHGLSLFGLIAVAHGLFTVFCSQGNEGVSCGTESSSPQVHWGEKRLMGNIMGKDKNLYTSFTPTQLHCILLIVLWVALIPGNISRIDGYQDLTGILAKGNLRIYDYWEQNFKPTVGLE